MHSIEAFISWAMKQPMLDEGEDMALARAWREKGHKESLDKLQIAYMSFAIAAARRYKYYGLPIEDLISEAMVGLVRAAERYEPDQRVHFSTYAIWWIKAMVQEYVIRNISMVRIGTTASQKKVFFHYRRQRNKLQRQALLKGESLEGHELRVRIAAALNVSVSDVEQIQGAFQSTALSLNTPLMSEEADADEWIDRIEDDSLVVPGMEKDGTYLSSALAAALGQLSERHRYVVMERKMFDESRTLQSLGDELGLSRERVRQIEAAGLARLRKVLMRTAPEVILMLDDA